MKKPTNLRSSLLNAAILTAVAAVPSVQAATLYWDVNGPTPGAGTAGGTWDSGTNWSTDSTGSSATVGWVNGESAVFSASTDATAAKTVTIAGTIATPSILLEEAGAVTLSGGSIDISGGSVFNTSVFGGTGGFQLAWNPAIIGTGDLTLAAHGDLSAGGGGSNSFLNLTGANTFTGQVTITSGVVHAASNFGDAANEVLLDGGGLIDPNVNVAFARNLEIGPAGGTIRNWGSVNNFRLQGTLSGSGTLTRTDGGLTILTGDGTGFTGSLNLLRGTTQIGAGTATTNLLPNATAATLGDTGAGATLRYQLDTSFTLPTAISFGNAGSSIQWQGTGADDVMTINSALGNDTAIGNLRVNSGAITLATGANVNVASVSLTSTPANSASALIGTLNIEAGAEIASRYFNIGEGGNTAGAVNQTGGSVVVDAGGTGFRIGHWNQGVLTPGSVYNLSGGTLDASALSANAGTARFVNVGWDGLGTMTVGGGTGTATLKAAGIQIDANGDSPTYNSSLSVTTNGRVEIGSLGTSSPSANDRILLDGGSLVATDNSNWAATTAANTASTFDVDGFNPILGGNIIGSAAINVIDTFGGGSLGLGGGAASTSISAALSGSVPIFKTGSGTVNLSGTSPYTGTLSLAAGTLAISGSFGGNVIAEDLGNLSGEGSIGGDLTLGNAAGTQLLVDPATPGSLGVTGNVTLTGTSSVTLANPLTTIDPVIEVLQYGTLTGNPASGLLLVGQSFYRSANFSDDSFNSRVLLSIDTKALTWDGTGGLWDVSSSSNWSDGAPSSFFWGDLVTFDDTATVTNVGLVGELQPGQVVVDSDTNNFVFNNAGQAQVETALALGNVATDGDVIVTLTGADLPSSPLAITVAVLTGDTASTWAGKVRTALSGNLEVNNLFTIGGTDANIVLTRKAVNSRFFANDATLNIDLANGSPDPGITPNPTSADTTAGYPTSFIGGSGNLVKKGSSILTINAPNTYTGGTVISEGSINIRRAEALGTGTVTLGDSATGTSNVALYLDTNRVNFGRQVLVSNNGTGTATLGSRANIGGAADNNQFTNIVLQRDVIFDSNAADRTDYENITGTGNITVTGTNRSVFPTTPSTWTGDLTISTTGANGSVQIGVASTGGDRIPDTSDVTVTAGGLLRFSTTSETIAGLFGAGTVNTNAPSGGTATLTVGFGGADGNFSGLLTGGPNILALTKIGAGTQIISGDSSYTGVTNITGGTIQAGNGGATGDIGSGNVTLSAGATLTYNRTGAVTLEGLLGSAAAGAGTLNINGDATTALTLAGANAGFSGIININQGSLVFGATNPTGTAANAPVMNIAAGATLTNAGTSAHAHIGTLNLTGGATVTTGSGTGSYNGENYQLNGNVTVSGGSTAAVITREASRTNANSGLALGILNGAKVFTVADVTGSPAPDLVISTELENPDNGTGALTKAGPGTMQLAGGIAHSYSGATTVSGGVLLASGSIVGTLTVQSTGTLAPGASAGSFAAGASTIDGTYACEIDGATADSLAVTGNLTLGATSTLAVTTLGGGATLPTYIIASYTGTRSGSFGTVTGLPAGYSVNYDDANKRIEITNVVADAYGAWEVANGISGDGADTDSDNDGIPNGIEFVIGGDPSGPGSDSSALLPTLSTDATYLNFVFRRTDDSASYDPFVEYGSTLAGWTTAEAGVNGVIVNEDDDFFGTDVDRVTVRIPRALATGSKLFARLRIDIP
jgi:autotransporter-associated beta strand protein